MQAKFAYQIGKDVSNDGDGVLAEGFFQRYSDDQSYEDGFEDALNGKYVVDLIKAVWDRDPSYKLLDCGSANGLTLEEFGKFDIEAWGIENSAYIHSKTPEQWRERNLLGDVCKMPFEDDAFDFLYVTAFLTCPKKRSARRSRRCFGYVVWGRAPWRDHRHDGGSHRGL